MSDEVVTILVMDNQGNSSIRKITDAFDTSDTAWPHLVEVFMEQLQGLGYGFISTPGEMADVLNEFHQQCIHEKYDHKEENPVVEEKKYPYTGMYTDKDGITLVTFDSPKHGRCIFSNRYLSTTGRISNEWNEDTFTKVSK